MVELNMMETVLNSLSATHIAHNHNDVENFGRLPLPSSDRGQIESNLIKFYSANLAKPKNSKWKILSRVWDILVCCRRNDIRDKYHSHVEWRWNSFSRLLHVRYSHSSKSARFAPSCLVYANVVGYRGFPILRQAVPYEFVRRFPYAQNRKTFHVTLMESIVRNSKWNGLVMTWTLLSNDIR